MRCFITYKQRPAGYVNLMAEFSECQSEAVSFRFETAFLRRKLRAIGVMNVKVKVILGEEELQTQPHKDDKDAPPKWIDEILLFSAPKQLSKGKIIVQDEDKEMGHVNIDVKQLLKEKE